MAQKFKINSESTTSTLSFFQILHLTMTFFINSELVSAHMTFNRHVKSKCDILVPTVKIEGNEYVLRLLQAYLGPFQTTKLKPFCEKS